MVEYQNKRHPIRLVANRTGLSRDVLRAWEFRYGAVQPRRTAGGQRLYSDEDVDRLKLLRLASEAGRRIGQIAQLSMAELQNLAQEDERATLQLVEPEPSGPGETRSRHFLDEALAAVESLDAAGLEATLGRALISLTATKLIETVISPLMARLGELWWNDRLDPSHEHLATSVVRRVLDDIWTTARKAEGPRLMVATPKGQLHEIGAMLAAAAAATEGWHVTYLGPDLPAESIAAAAKALDARAVALSIIYPTDDDDLPAELMSLRRDLPEDVTILVGGQGASRYAEALEEISAVRLRSATGLAAALGLAVESNGNGRSSS